MTNRPIGGRPGAALSLVLLAATAIGAGACGGGSDERARLQADAAALRAELDELKKRQAAVTQEQQKQAEQLKAIDAQQAFLVSEAQTSKEALGRAQASVEQSEAAVREMRAAVEDLQRKAAAPPPTSQAPAKPEPSASSDEAADKLYATAMASFRAEEHGQAVLEFADFVSRFPSHREAPSAQYWIGEAYFRQRDFRQALAEFQKVIDTYPSAAQVPEALLKIGLCHRALRDAARARASWEQVTRTYPGTSAAAHARALLSEPSGSGRPAR